MIPSIIFLIFENFCGSFRDTWFSDDFGIFPKVFRIRNRIPGIRLSNYFSFFLQENIFFFPLSFLFPIFFSSFSFHQILQNSPFFHYLLQLSTKNIKTPKISSPKYPTSPITMAGQERDTSPSPFYKNPLSKYLFTSPSQIQFLYKPFLLHFTSFFSSPTP